MIDTRFALQSGTIAMLDRRGFGFIVAADGERWFFGRSDLLKHWDWKDLHLGDDVQFRALGGPPDPGRQWHANRVRLAGHGPLCRTQADPS